MKKFTKTIPYRIYDNLHRRIQIFYYNKFCLPKLLKNISKKETINVAFEAWNISMWKYHSLYEAMRNDSRFNPVVILTPSPRKEDYIRRKHLAEMQKLFSSRNYNIYPEIIWDSLSYDNLNDDFDLIFYCQPYRQRKLSRTIKTHLWGYSEYGYSTNTNSRWCENTMMKNITFMYCADSQLSIEDAKRITISKGRNRTYTGYLFGDELLNPIKTECFAWKIQDNKCFKIIWAPHFSIDPNHVLKLSHFLEICDGMIELTKKYMGKVQFVFKPHPFLYNQLCQTEGWGKEKADAYYDFWKTADNCQFEDGLYTHLFHTADAIIHDCASFTVDWLFTKKPGFYVSDKSKIEDFNLITNEAFNCYYKGTTITDIEQFINNVVINKIDTMISQRETFFNKYLLPPNGKSAAENVIDTLCEKIWNK